ncbi:phage major capsid protein, P2 family [Edwardsiella tarda]|uniref:phage major capsid protein, P2 family n=1 Tax=Edwardsiella tarda TaxID=636 RepID=UPI003081E7DA|nr:phage major capsid protein, P2 family [Edwardsiella tarda]
MNKQTEQRFSQLQVLLAKQYDANEGNVMQGKYFSITGPQESKFIDAIQARSDFLQKINLIPVTDIAGEKVLAGAQKTITGRKKTGRYRRVASPLGGKYVCVETDSGIVIPWHLMDVWARMGDRFLEVYATYVQQQIGLDQIMIGWRGTSVAEDTDPETNQLLQDVNKGWMQWMRENKAANILTEGDGGGGKIKIFGDGADYANLDQLGYDLRQGLGDVHRERTDLVFMVGADLVAKEADLVSKAHGLTPTERGAIKQHELMGTFGGMPAATLPNFPARGAVITTFDNLSIYTQSGSMRRKVKDDDEQKGVVDSYYRNEAYVVEDESLFVGIEFDNVVLPGDKAVPGVGG